MVGICIGIIRVRIVISNRCSEFTGKVLMQQSKDIAAADWAWNGVSAGVGNTFYSCMLERKSITKGADR